jgi:HEAT repeat protein
MVRRTYLFALLLLLTPSPGFSKDSEPRKPEKDKAFDGKPLPQVLDELKDADPKVRLRAARALWSFPTRDAVPALCKALEDTEPSVAEWAARALGRVGPDAREVSPTLIERLKRPPSEEFREATLIALGKIGAKSEEVVPLLIEQLQRKQAPIKTRQAAAGALGEFGTRASAAVPPLVEALDERDLEAAAVGALLRMGKEARTAAPALSKRIKPENTYWLEVVQYLADVSPEHVRPALSDLRALAASAPVRDQGIVNFRDSQKRIAEAKKLLEQLEAKGIK